MATPINRQQFRETCMRRLGYPVIPIALDNDQIEDIIDYCLNYYYDYHFDGTLKKYIKHKLTQEDKEAGYITVPETVIGITRVIDSGGLINASDSLFDVRYQIALNDLFNLTSVSMVPYYLSMRHIEMINTMFNITPQIRYNRNTDKLFLDLNWTSTPVGTYIVIEAYEILDPNQYSDIWNDRWLLRYTVEHLKKQWATHLKMYNVTLIGGVTYNGQQMYNEAIAEIEKLEEEMIFSYSLPVSDMLGTSF